MLRPYFQEDGVTLLNADALEGIRDLSSGSIQCCITSPPYWGLRDYGVPGQIGLERTPEEYTARLVEVFREVRRVLKNNGTLWLNLGDTYAADGRDMNSKDAKRTVAPISQPNRTKLPGLKVKDLVGIPWMVAFALRADGWYLRSDIIWHKPNPMPESVTDRPTKAHEYLFLLSKSSQYYYDAAAIAEPTIPAKEVHGERLRRGFRGEDDGPSHYVNQPDVPENSTRYGPSSYNGSTFTRGKTAATKPNVGQGERADRDTRNKRSVWTVSTEPFPDAHFATFPESLIEPCVKAGCPAGGTILDPFGGAATVGVVAKRFGCKAILIELNPAYCKIAAKRLRQGILDFSTASVQEPG